ncbi:T-cell surface antigen CD2-like [Xyrauchen texanus]|uniref:T-cell surface antigen CD2-like n=1 Tax=Xyrauchen texanus TaxID=154827 RepID=UPI0022423CD0|nr:T-cell surface antigen CD2-like [Xyrauchen texanus]
METRIQSSRSKDSFHNLKQHSHSSAGIGLFWKLDVREMLFIFGLLLLLIPTHTCVEMFCRFNQTDPCYTSLGHKLYLQMVMDARNVELRFKKGTDSTADAIFRVKNNKIMEFKEYESIRNRSEFIFNNGTLILNSVIRSDSGTYRLEIYNSDGTHTHTNNLQVIVEAPIGSVEVSINCSSSGEKRVSCSSEGDQLIFNWTLNGQELEDGNNTIHLDEEISGSITCTVKNHISHGQYTTRVNRCAGTTTATVTSHLTSTVNDSTQTSGHVVSVVVALGSGTVILILLVITVYHIYKKRKQFKPTAEVGDDTELVYAHITHKKLKRKDEHKRSELTPTGDVEYATINHQTKMKMMEEV